MAEACLARACHTDDSMNQPTCPPNSDDPEGKRIEAAQDKLEGRKGWIKVGVPCLVTCLIWWPPVRTEKCSESVSSVMLCKGLSTLYPTVLDMAQGVRLLDTKSDVPCLLRLQTVSHYSYNAVHSPECCCTGPSQRHAILFPKSPFPSRW